MPLLAYLAEIVWVRDSEGLCLDGRLSQQAADEIFRSHRSVAHGVLEAVALFLDDEAQQWTRCRERPVKVVVVVDGQQVIVARINVGDEEGQAADFV